MTNTIALPVWFDGPNYNAQILRNADAAALAYNGNTYAGVFNQASRLGVASSSGMNITVNPGVAIIPSSLGATQGAYRVNNSLQQTLTVTTSDPVNSRIDIVVVGVTDNGDSTSTGYISIVAGTPAGSPVAPAVPSNALLLAQIAVGAGVTSITSGNITDKRVYTTTPGGIVRLANTTSPPDGSDGIYAYDGANDRLFHLANTGPRQARTLPFAPVTQVLTTDKGTGNSVEPVLSASVTTDGATDVAIYVKWTAIYANSGSGEYRAQMQLFIDSTQVDNFYADGQSGGTGIFESGGAYYHYTSSALGDTPSAGTHTITWKLAAINIGTDFVYIKATSTAPAILRVSPVSL